MYNLNVLIVDDEINALRALKSGLEKEVNHIFTATGRNEAINLIKTTDIDVVLTDLKLKDGSGLEVIHFIQENYKQTPVVILTAYGSVESAIEAIRTGAYEYIVKPFRMSDIKRLLERLNEIINLRNENENLKQRLNLSNGVPELIGSTPRFKQIIEFIKQIAPSRSTVLITGETGTGKELAARAIHFYSNRFNKSMIRINCSAIPENLLESELFGYEPGAFTGAMKQKKGKIELAHKSTLFLDEISELTLTMQAKILRVIESEEFERLGGTETQKVDVRFIVATNRDLQNEVNAGKFREDLYYRLNVIVVHMLPLRERLEDIPILVQYFISKYNELNEKNVQGVDHEVIKLLLRHPWRGNVRELENMVERAVVLSQEEILKPYHFPGLSVINNTSNLGIEVGMSLAEIEKEAIQKTLIAFHNDKQKTSMALQIGLATLYRKIKEYGLE